MVFKPDKTILFNELFDFLQKNDVVASDIDVVVNGVSGDVQQDVLLADVCKTAFDQIPELRFKHLTGEYCTASAFGMWVGASVLRKQLIPHGIQFNAAPIPAVYRLSYVRKARDY